MQILQWWSYLTANSNLYWISAWVRTQDGNYTCPHQVCFSAPLSTDVLVAWGGSENSLAETPAAFSKASSQSITSVMVLGRALTVLLLVSLYN